MARRASLLRCLVAYPLLGLSGVLLAQEIPGGIPPGATLDDAADDPFADAVLNYDASTFLTDGSTKDGSDNVTKWANKGTGGSTYDLTVVNGTPLYVASGINSLGSIDFEAGDNDVLYVNATPVTAAPFHVFVVVSFETGVSQSVWWIGDKDVNNTHMWNGRLFGTGPVARYSVAGAGTTDMDHGGTLSTATTYLMEFRSTAANDRGVNVDDGTEATNATSRTPSGADRFALGRREDGTPDLPLDAMLGHYLLYGSIQTGATRDAIIAALDSKWAIPGVTSSPPLGPSDPFPWLLAAVGLALLALSLPRRRRKPEGRLLRFEPEAARLAA